MIDGTYRRCRARCSSTSTTRRWRGPRSRSSSSSTSTNAAELSREVEVRAAAGRRLRDGPRASRRRQEGTVFGGEPEIGITIEDLLAREAATVTRHDAHRTACRRHASGRIPTQRMAASTPPVEPGRWCAATPGVQSAPPPRVNGLIETAAVRSPRCVVGAHHGGHRLHPGLRVARASSAMCRCGSSSPTPSGRRCSPTRTSASCRCCRARWPARWSRCCVAIPLGTIIAIYLSEFASRARARGRQAGARAAGRRARRSSSATSRCSSSPRCCRFMPGLPGFNMLSRRAW